MIGTRSALKFGLDEEFMVFRPMGDELFHAEIHDEANNRFSQGKAPKKEKCPGTHLEGMRECRYSSNHS